MKKTDFYGSFLMSALFTVAVVLGVLVLTGSLAGAIYLGGAAFVALFAVQNAVYMIGWRIEKALDDPYSRVRR